MIDHVQLVVMDLAASKRFYTAVFEALSIPLGDHGEDHFWYDELFVSSRESGAASDVLTGRTHLAFQAEDQEAVDRFHRVALAAGGRDNGAPGERPYHPGYYAAFVLDPDGNSIEAVYHGPARRSANSVEITF
jgi:catechol 2,3-dioxygenase-like lactoylglutathione lyase family enzyme